MLIKLTHYPTRQPFFWLANGRKRGESTCYIKENGAVFEYEGGTAAEPKTGAVPAGDCGSICHGDRDEG